MIRLEYIAYFGPFLLAVLYKSELFYPIQLDKASVALFIEMHTSLGPNMIEELIYGDMGINYKLGTPSVVIDNISTYAAYLMCLPVLGSIQWIYTGKLLR